MSCCTQKGRGDSAESEMVREHRDFVTEEKLMAGGIRGEYSFLDTTNRESNARGLTSQGMESVGISHHARCNCPQSKNR